MKSPVRWLLTAAAIVGIIALWRYYERDYRPAFTRSAGTLVQVRDSTEVGWSPDGQRLTDVTLVSDTGLRVRVRTRARGDRSGVRRPAAILVGGIETGRRAVDLPPVTGDLVLVGVDYPYDGPLWPRGWRWLLHVVDLRSSMIEMPSALLLAAQYAYAREDVDPDRVSIVGVSLGVPFAAATAATDRRLASAALLHGGADLRRLAAYAFRNRGDPWIVDLLARAIALAAAPLEPAKYAGAIAPRPTLVVVARDDEFIDPGGAQALVEAVRAPRRVVWIDTDHVRGDRREIVTELLDITLEWLESSGLAGLHLDDDPL